MKKTIKSIILTTIALAVLIGLPAPGFAQVPGVIGVKFGFTAASGYGSSTVLAPTDAAGILVDGVVAVTNWNNFQTGLPLNTGINTTWNIAQDSAGNALSGVTMTPAGFDDGWYNGGTDCANARLLYAVWKFNSSNNKFDSGGHNCVTLTFANLPASEYDVYAYINDNNGNYWGNAKANTVVAVGSSVDNAGFNGADSDPCGSTPQLHTATGYGNPANYVAMPAVATTAGGVITVTVVLQGGDFGVAGIELVPTGTVIATGPATAGAPVESPTTANLAVGVGQSVTLTAQATGALPIAYAWQTDGASGNTPTNIPGATATTLVVNTTGLLPGTYVYDYTVTNSEGGSISSTVNIVVEAVFMEDIGATTPTPGPTDISQLLNTQQADDGFNYYTDNGANHNEWNGQTFTTGSNPDGYVLNSLAWKSAGNGNSFPTLQLYDLYIYSLSANGANATVIASYQAYGGGTELDWLKWIGLNVPLAPNTMYAYALGRDSTATGWEHIANQGGSPYAGGQICQIPSGGGTVSYGTVGASSATFDLGIIVSPVPHASAPAYTPDVTPIYAGTPVTLLETATGQPPLSYQWLTDNGLGGALTPISGATSASLPVNTTAFNAGTYNYQVIVTNTSGMSTSAVVALTFVAASAPQLVTDISPSPNEGYVGQTVTYSATFTGTLPISYQWMLDTGNGSGPQPISAASNPSAISNTLVLASLQLANAGIYSLAANNSVGGPLSSSSSTLTVLPDPAAPASGTYQAMILSNKPVAYWPLNDTGDPTTGALPAYDASGHNLDGLYGVNCEVGYAGPQSPAFPTFAAGNTALLDETGETNSWVTVPALNLDTNAVTITMWIYPIGPVGTSSGLFFNRTLTDAAGLCFGTVANASGMAELGYTWNTNSSTTWGFNSGLYPLANQWSFVALVVQPTQATLYLYYIDPTTGLPDLYSAVNAIPHGPEPFTAQAITIGDDLDLGTATLSRVFNGAIDDVAVFNSSLTSDQILQEFSFGAGLSEVAASIGGQPQPVATYAGKTVHFTATGINGSSPLTYQWQWNGNNLTDGGQISGSKTASLTITDVTPANDGTYQLLITNPTGITPSSNATLVVISPVANSYESAVLADNPFVFWKLNETSDPSVGGVVAYDYVQGLDGVYQTAAQDGFNNILGPEAPAFPGFPAVNSALGTVENTADSYVTASAGTLTASTLTYAMWIYPTGPVENWAGLLMDRGGVGEGLGFGGATDGTGMSELGYTWNQNTTWSYNSLLFPTANEWSFVAMVIQPTQATLYLINSSGVQSATNAVAQDTEEFGVAWHIGNDAQDGGNGGRTFPGSIADVSVYLTALSGSQLTALYDAGLQIIPPVTLTIAPSGTGSATLTWAQGTLLESTNVAGPWVSNPTATSPYTVGATNASTFFKVLVTP